MINVLLALMIVGSFLVAIVLHELGHTLMAGWLGDATPRAEGRQSFSLEAHIDPVGLLMCVILAFQVVKAPVALRRVPRELNRLGCFWRLRARGRRKACASPL